MAMATDAGRAAIAEGQSRKSASLYGDDLTRGARDPIPPKQNGKKWHKMAVLKKHGPRNLELNGVQSNV